MQLFCRWMVPRSPLLIYQVFSSGHLPIARHPKHWSQTISQIPAKTLLSCVSWTQQLLLIWNAAVKEIAAAGKMSNTILALTKCDEVQDVDSILDKIFDPLENFNGKNSKVPGIEPLEEFSSG